MRTFAYMEGSSDIEDPTGGRKNLTHLQKQKQAILAFAKIKEIYISRFIEVSISKQITNEQKSDLLMGQLDSFDMLIVSDLSRIAHSVAEIITTVNTLHWLKMEFALSPLRRRLISARTMKTKNHKSWSRCLND